MNRRFVGVDLHKRLCHFTELGSEGNVIKKGKFGNNFGEVAAFAASLGPGTKLTVEPVLNYLWFLDQVIPYVESVYPANPSKVRVIAEAKTKCDRYDSLMLAELLRTNFLPESYYVPQEIRSLRDLIRQRSQLVAMRRVFVEAAIIAPRKSPALNRLLNRVLYKSNIQKARVAVAHKLARITYAMLSRGESFMAGD